LNDARDLINFIETKDLTEYVKANSPSISPCTSKKELIIELNDTKNINTTEKNSNHGAKLHTSMSGI